MKKFIFLWLVLTSVCLCGCSWLNHPANVEIIGISNIQNDGGTLFVEVNSEKYVPHHVYTGMGNPRTGKEKMFPVEGMKVTCFTTHSKSTVLFIAGEYTRDQLEVYFKENYSLLLLFFFIIFTVLILMLILSIAPQKKKG